MPYLLPSDYQFIIQDSAVEQIIANKERLRTYGEEVALSEINAYLGIRYDTAREFRDTNVYDTTKTYSALDRVILDYTVWLDSATYSIGDMVVGSDLIAYKALQASDSALPQDPVLTSGYWEALGDQYDIFLAVTPKPEWEWNRQYKIGEEVFYLGYTYTAKNEGYNKNPEETHYWDKSLTAYVVPADSLLDTTYWSLKDDRDKKIVWCAAIIVLLNIVKRISPKNVPMWIEEAYKGKQERDYVGKQEIYKNPSTVVGWLSMVKEGDVLTSMKSFPYNEGNRIRMVSNDKRGNVY